MNKNYNSTTNNKKYQVPIATGNDGGITATAGANYKKIKEAEFTGGTGAKQPISVHIKGEAKLSAKFDNGAELQFEVLLRRICRIENVNKCYQLVKHSLSPYTRQMNHFCLPHKILEPIKMSSSN